MTKNEFFEFYVNTFRETYIKVYGKEKWDSLTDEQKHEATMIVANDLLNLLK